MSTPETPKNRRPPGPLARLGAAAIAAAMILAGPVMIGVGTRMVAADAEIAHTGLQTNGTIVDFDDTRRSSQRDITVTYTANDGADRSIVATVDHDQHPAVGEDVTVAYREEQPGTAVVLGYESQGASVRGVGTILTLVFTTTGLILVYNGIRRSRRKKRTV